MEPQNSRLSSARIKKYKRLKPWQSRFSNITCAICNSVIGRDEYRYRCEDQTYFDVCCKCFDEHWVKILADINSMEDLDERRWMLRSLPEAAKGLPQYREAEAALSKARSEKATLQDDDEPVSPVRALWNSLENGNVANDKLMPLLGGNGRVKLGVDHVQAGLWMSVWCLALPAVGLALQELDHAKDVSFPYPLVAVALAGFGATLLCWVVLIVRGDAHVAVELLRGNSEFQRQVAILGLLLGVEASIGALMLPYANWIQVTTHMVIPVLTLIVVAMAHGQRMPQAVLLAATALAALGGLLADLQKPRKEWLLQVPFALIAVIVLSFRWVLLQLLLQLDRVTRPPATLSPLIFAAGIMPTAAMVCAEATVVFQRDGIVALAHLEQPSLLAAVLVGLTVGIFLLILSEMHAIQLTSAPALSMLVPVVHVGTIAAVALADQRSPAADCLFSLCICVAALVLYYNPFPAGVPEEDESPSAAPRIRRSNTNTPMFPASLGFNMIIGRGPKAGDSMARQPSWMRNTPTGPGVAPLFAVPKRKNQPDRPQTGNTVGVAPLQVPVHTRAPLPAQARAGVGVAALTRQDSRVRQPSPQKQPEGTEPGV